MNKVLLTGRLTRDPEMRSLASGKHVTTFTREHGYFEMAEVERILARKNSVLPWYLFNFALWHETWIEQAVPTL